MKRRHLILPAGIAAAGVLAMPLMLVAQQPPQRIGVLRETAADALYKAFVDRLRELGRIEGGNLAIDYRQATNAADLERAARELAAQLAAVIFAPTPFSALAANRAQTTVPIVFAVVGDPVQNGLAKSLSRPGGNATGLTAFGSDLGGKRLDLLRQVVPGLRRVGVLWNSAVLDKQIEWRNLQEAARAAGVELHSVEVTNPDQFDAAFASLKQASVDAIVVLGEPLMFTNINRIVIWATAARLPSVFNWRQAAVAGAPIAYGPSVAANYRRAADYVDRILRGAKAADLPIEQPTRIELVVNAGAAKALGLSLPSVVLAGADEVIE